MGCANTSQTDFDAIYVLDLGGNVRKNPKLIGYDAQCFRHPGRCQHQLAHQEEERENGVSTETFYANVDEFWRKEQKYRYLDEKEQYSNIEWEAD